MRHLYVTLFLLNIFFIRISCTNYAQMRIDNSYVPMEKFKSIPWYFRVPLLPILFATSSTLPDGNCKSQAQKYLENLNNGTLWAMRMFDASTKYPEGIMTGHTRHYGNFDECYQLRSIIKNYLSESEVEVIEGKYCLVTVKYDKLNMPMNKFESYHLDFDLSGSAWEAIKEKGDFRRIKRYTLEMALCVPDACSSSDIKKALSEPLKKFGIEQQILVTTGIKSKCQTRKQSPEFSIAAKIYCCTILGLLIIVAMSTYYDMSSKNNEKQRNKSLTANIFLSFSMQRNYTNITQITFNHPGLDSIHLLRFLFMCCTVMGHRLLQYYTNPMINSEYFEYSYTSPFLIMFHNGALIVEFFFAFGGMLLAYCMLFELDKRKKINFLTAILIRYFRFTPSYLVVIGFIALVLPQLGSGPYWEYKIGFDSNNCAENWWANLLYINNYVNTHKLCMFQSWYLSVDFQLYIIGLFTIYLYWKMPRKFGYLFLIAMIIAGFIIPVYFSYFHHVQPIYRDVLDIQDVREDPYFIHHYVKTHERLSSYFVGVLGGAIIYDHSLSPWSIPKPWSHIPFVLGAFLVGIKLQIMGFKFYDPNINITPIENALYTILSRPIFAMCIVSTIIFISVSDKLEFHHKLFKPRWVQPLARLTYGVYLIHNVHQSYDVGVTRNVRTFSIHNVLWDMVPDIILSFIISFLLAIVVEGPFRRIEKLLIIRQSYVYKSKNESHPILIKKSN